MLAVAAFDFLAGLPDVTLDGSGLEAGFGGALGFDVADARVQLQLEHDHIDQMSLLFDAQTLAGFEKGVGHEFHSCL